MGTASWCWLVHWRVGRHRTALWKSLVLPSAGAALCWLLLMTLWLPLLNYARSYLPLVNQVKQVIPADACMAVQGLTTGQLAALKWHGPWKLHNLTVKNECPWLLVDAQWAAQAQNAPQLQAWSPVQKVNRPTRTYENLLIYRRNASAAENRLTP